MEMGAGGGAMPDNPSIRPVNAVKEETWTVTVDGSLPPFQPNIKPEARCSLLTKYVRKGAPVFGVILLVVLISKIPGHAKRWGKGLITAERQRVGTAGALCESTTWGERRSNEKAVVSPHMLREGGCADITLSDSRQMRCQLAVVNAGMPRSGSTLISLLIREAIDHLNLTTVKAHGPIYWQQHLRVAYSRKAQNATERCRLMRERYEDDKSKLANILPSDIVLIKAHEFDAELLDMCDRTLVISGTRDVADIVFSKVRLGWVKLDPEESRDELIERLIFSVQGAVREHNCWQRYSPRFIQMLFEDISSNYGLAVAKIATGIADALSTKRLSLLPALNLSKIDSKFRHREGNPWQRSTRKIVNATLAERLTLANDAKHRSHIAAIDSVLTPEVASQIRQAYASFQSAHGLSRHGKRVIPNVPQAPSLNDAKEVPRPFFDKTASSARGRRSTIPSSHRTNLAKETALLDHQLVPPSPLENQIEDLKDMAFAQKIQRQRARDARINSKLARKHRRYNTKKDIDWELSVR